MHKQRSSKKSDLYLNQGLRKSRFPLNLTGRRTDISNYRVASLPKKLLRNNCIYKLFHVNFFLLATFLFLNVYYQGSPQEGRNQCNSRGNALVPNRRNALHRGFRQRSYTQKVGCLLCSMARIYDIYGMGLFTITSAMFVGVVTC